VVETVQIPIVNHGELGGRRHMARAHFARNFGDAESAAARWKVTSSRTGHGRVRTAGRGFEQRFIRTVTNPTDASGLRSHFPNVLITERTAGYTRRRSAPARTSFIVRTRSPAALRLSNQNDYIEIGRAHRAR
jgi:hypothetical protein